MTQQDVEAIIGIVTLAAMADGERDASEQEKISSVAARLGYADADAMVQRAASGEFDVQALAAKLGSAEARESAFDSAVAVCHADGTLRSTELAFLESLRSALGIDEAKATQRMSSVAAIGSGIAADSAAPLADSAPGVAGSTAGSTTGSTAGGATTAGLDDYILEQAMLTAALEFLPDRLANLGILPLQLRLVRSIGQRHGQQMGADQIKDLAATFGIGAAAQIMESVVRRTLGGFAGGIFGGMLGSAAGLAAGGAVTFASTYALGHAAQQYYEQNRSLTPADMRSLFARFQGEANTMFPRVQERVMSLARDNSYESILRMVRG